MVGLPENLREAPLEVSICQFTIKEPDVTEICNLKTDYRTSHLPSVAPEGRLRYYFGVPPYYKKQIRHWYALCSGLRRNEVMTHLELHKQNQKLQKLNEYKL